MSGQNILAATFGVKDKYRQIGLVCAWPLLPMFYIPGVLQAVVSDGLEKEDFVSSPPGRCDLKAGTSAA